MSGRVKNPDRVRWPLKIAILTKYGTETEFARVLGISRQQLTHIIVGRNPGWHIRKKASELLGFSEAYLFGSDSGKDN
ncbi:MAG: helix-turn-helix transcriptional regulator [bacterium]